MPAWLIPGRSRTWAIVVHGINGTPQEGLHLAPALRRLGIPAMLITYRGDLGAPAGPDGFHHMGLTEWRDLAAAAALRARARSPAPDPGRLLDGRRDRRAVHGALAARAPGQRAWCSMRRLSTGGGCSNSTRRRQGFPVFAALPLEWAIGARIDADWDSLDAIGHAEDFHLPILLFHGTEDKVVPISLSEDFAAALPSWVSFYRVPRAGHVESWNVDPRLYERRLTAFLSPLAG